MRFWSESISIFQWQSWKICFYNNKIWTQNKNRVEIKYKIIISIISINYTSVWKRKNNLYTYVRLLKRELICSQEEMCSQCLVCVFELSIRMIEFKKETLEVMNQKHLKTLTSTLNNNLRSMKNKDEFLTF